MKTTKLISKQNAIVGRTISLQALRSQLSSDASNILSYNKNEDIQEESELTI